MTYSDPMEVDPREEKLPRWAQEKLTHARRRVRDAESARDQARLATNPDQSTALLYLDAGDHLPIGLDRDYGNGKLYPANVRFRLGLNSGIPLRAAERRGMYVDCRVEGTQLVVHGGAALVIQPWVTNVVRIECSRD